MWWKRQAKVDPNAALVQLQREQIQYLMLQHDTDQQRMDRLMEALARRAGVDLVMPMPVAVPTSAPIPLPNPWKDHNPVTTNFKEMKTQ